jgi:hypothetical protein
MNLKELASVFHFPVGISGQAQLKEASSGKTTIIALDEEEIDIDDI